MDINNKKLGNDFEKEMAEILSRKGYWVVMITPKNHINSQPMDLVAAKNNILYCFECKTLHSKNKKFPLSRIEQNQRSAYKKLKETGNNNYYLIVKWNDEDIYSIPFQNIDFGKKYLNLEDKYKTEEE